MIQFSQPHPCSPFSEGADQPQPEICQRMQSQLLQNQICQEF